MKWISVKDRLPNSEHIYVLVTDGKLITLANYHANARVYYGNEIDEEDFEYNIFWIDENSCWGLELFDDGFGPFINGESCFGDIQEITHWMPLPNPPKE